METGTLVAKETSGVHAARVVESPHEPILDSVLTNAAVNGHKRQAPAGCVLCALDAWDEEEWD